VKKVVRRSRRHRGGDDNNINQGNTVYLDVSWRDDYITNAYYPIRYIVTEVKEVIDENNNKSLKYNIKQKKLEEGTVQVQEGDDVKIEYYDDDDRSTTTTTTTTNKSAPKELIEVDKKYLINEYKYNKNKKSFNEIKNLYSYK
jgi:hypothetical protein